jgi:hypothetical protein
MRLCWHILRIEVDHTRLLRIGDTAVQARRWAMQITMIPGLCSNEHRSTGGTFCESCFSAFLMHGCYPDRPCITDVVDDGKEKTTLVLSYGEQQKVMVISDENRELLAYGGWPGWVQFVEELAGAPIAGPTEPER